MEEAMHKILRFVLFPWLLIFTSCCILKDNKEKIFIPEQVSCTDISSEELKERVKVAKGELREVAFFELKNEVFYDALKLANQGNMNGMFIYGTWLHDSIKKEFHYNNYGNKAIYILPDMYRNEMIMAMTYILLSGTLSDSHLSVEQKEFMKKTLHRIEKNEFDTKVPGYWIFEAKLNVIKWQEYCKISYSRLIFMQRLKGFTGGDIVSGIGKPWNKRPKSYSHLFITAQANHEYFDSLINYKPSKEELSAQEMLNILR